MERDSLGNAKVVKIFRKQQTLLERDGVGNVKVVKNFNSRKQQALLERDGLGNAKKEITIKQGTEDARLEGLQQDNAENKRPRNEIGVLEADRNREP